MPDVKNLYDPFYDQWPDLEYGRVVLAPVRVGMDRRTGRIKVGWGHVTQSVEVIFMTRFHERVLRRWVGSFVPHILGQSIIVRIIARFFWAAASAIELWEPCYRISRIRVDRRADGSALTEADEVRLGHITAQMEGVYRPRGHLGDDTPELKRGLGLIGRGYGAWEAAQR